MAKKYVSGENLVYALEHYEQQMIDAMEKITDIIPATEEEIADLFNELENK